MKGKMRGHLSLLVVVASAAAVLVIAPGAAAADMNCVGTNIGAFDNVVVQPGQTCVINSSTVSGNVKALQGSRLLFINSTVAGNVVGDKAAEVQVVTSTVGGNVELKETGPGVPIGGFFACGIGTFPFTICEAFVSQSTVKGNVQIDKTLGTAWVTDSVVRGNLKIEETKSTPIAEFLNVQNNNVGQNVQLFKNGGPGFALAIRNTVNSSLQCFENAYLSGFFGSTLNVAKEAQGQCSAAPLALSFFSLLSSPPEPVAVQLD